MKERDVPVRVARKVAVATVSDAQDVVALCEEPGNGDLAGRRVVLLRDPLDDVDDLEDLGEVLRGEAGEVAPQVGSLQLVR